MSISIIVPVYNSEKFLRKCLDSVINAINLATDEIVIVYDESLDKSFQVITEYIDRYSFIKFLHGNGKGCGMARNIGLRMASNEYVAFVDSDDSISDLFKYQDTYDNLDVVCFNYLFEDNFAIIKKCSSLNLLSNGKSLFYNFAITGDFATVVWDKIYRRDFLICNDIFFEEIPEWEDVVFSSKIASVLTLNKIRVFNILYYRALIRNDSRSRIVTIDFLSKAVPALYLAHDFIAPDNQEQAKLFKLYSIRHLNYFTLKYLSRSSLAMNFNIDPFVYNVVKLLFESDLPVHHKVIYILRQSMLGLWILKLLSFYYAKRVLL